MLICKQLPMKKDLKKILDQRREFEHPNKGPFPAGFVLIFKMLSITSLDSEITISGRPPYYSWMILLVHNEEKHNFRAQNIKKDAPEIAPP
ncbi:hypothetical protein ACOSP7_024118 [Xanthoceras sorbifolium]